MKSQFPHVDNKSSVSIDLTEEDILFEVLFCEKIVIEKQIIQRTEPTSFLRP